MRLGYFITIVLMLSITACGFKPLYGKQDLGKNLSQIKVGRIYFENRTPSKISFELKSVLKQELDWSYTDTPKVYVININYLLSVEGAAIQLNSIATRNNLKIILDYELIENVSGKVIIKERLLGVESYDINESPFSNYVSQEETAVRIMRNLANDIKLRLAGIDWETLNKK